MLDAGSDLETSPKKNYSPAMARPLRIEFAGAVYHITSRGNAREDIFDDNSDRGMFLKTLGQTVERHNWLCRTPKGCLSLTERASSLNNQKKHPSQVLTQRYFLLLRLKPMHILFNGGHIRSTNPMVIERRADWFPNQPPALQQSK